MFKREHHLRIATILQALDADLLAENECWFGGGTAIVLSHGEYRESIDIDFMVSSRAGYQALRTMLTSKGLQSITRKGMNLTALKDIRADQYGIRTMLKLGNFEIKFEIVLEGRISFGVPTKDDLICGVRTLGLVDMATSKLLANSDRWSDDSVYSRDLIDLAMLDLPKDIRKISFEKAKEAYGESIERDLLKAIKSLAGRRGRLDICMEALKIDDIPKALLWSKIRKLEKISKS